MKPKKKKEPLSNRLCRLVVWKYQRLQTQIRHRIAAEPGLNRKCERAFKQPVGDSLVCSPNNKQFCACCRWICTQFTSYSVFFTTYCERSFKFAFVQNPTHTINIRSWLWKKINIMQWILKSSWHWAVWYRNFVLEW